MKPRKSPPVILELVDLQASVENKASRFHEADIQNSQKPDHEWRHNPQLHGGKGGDHREDGEAVSLLSSSRLSEDEVESDDLMEFERVEFPEPGLLRRGAAYVLKRPQVACLAILAGSFLLPLLSSSLWGGTKYLTCEDRDVGSFDELIAGLTLEEKIGQMVVADLGDVGSGDFIRSNAIGGLLPSLVKELPLGNKPEDWLKISSHLQAKAMKSRKSIPILFGADAVHGHAGVYGATVFPHAMGLGATRNRTLVQEIGLAEARELRATGVRWALGPDLSVCGNPLWGGCYETYSEDEEVVTMMGLRMDGLVGLEHNNMGWNEDVITESLVAATGLGILGNGGTAKGITGGVTNEADDDFRTHYMHPLVDAVSRSIPLLQLARGSVNGEIIHNSSYLFKILKEQLNFQGVVLSAYEGLEDIPGDWATQVRTGVNRGIDMVVTGPGKAKKFLKTLKEEVATGGVKESRIDDAVKRVLQVKNDVGLLKSPCGTQNFSISIVGSDKHRELARSAVRQSLVLLKNGGHKKDPILPLPFDKVTVLVTGSHIDDIGLQCGGHTITLQGGEGRITKGTTILEGIKSTIGGRSKLIYERDPKDFDADFAIIAVGEKPYAGATGDGANKKHALELSIDSVELIRKVCDKVSCLVILVTGRPLVIRSVLPLVNALVVAWLPGSEGAGISDVIFQGREHNFVGTLPISWFNRVEDLVTTNGTDNHLPLFPLKFGLTVDGKKI